MPGTAGSLETWKLPFPFTNLDQQGETPILESCHRTDHQAQFGLRHLSLTSFKARPDQVTLTDRCGGAHARISRVNAHQPDQLQPTSNITATAVMAVPPYAD